MISEAQIQQAIRLAAPNLGIYLWRNNSGAMIDNNGRAVRYGLGNDSHKINKHMKSSDLIGITPVLITEKHIGQTLGVFTSVEVKREGWVKPTNERDRAQEQWLRIIVGAGGIGFFATDPTHVVEAIEKVR